MAKKTAAASGKTGSLVWVQGLACGVLAALAPSLALMVGVLLGPGILALALDHEQGKPVARAVLLCGLAACVDPVRRLWTSGHGMEIGTALISDIGTVGGAWSAAAAGWIISELTPIGVRAVLEAGTMTRAARLRSQRGKLAEEWGLPPPEQP
jgi:hypothetical protein